ncbi:leucyl aminopeptidase [Patescibacteria group bacterium]
MKYTVEKFKLKEIDADVLFVFSYKKINSDKIYFTSGASNVNEELDGVLNEVIKRQSFSSNQSSYLEISPRKTISVGKIVLVGCGNIKNLDAYKWQTVCAVIGKKAKALKANSVAVILPNKNEINISQDLVYKGFVEAFELSTYKFNKYQNQNKAGSDIKIEKVMIISDMANSDKTKIIVELAETISQAVVFTRDLVNDSPSVTTPSYLASVAQKIADNSSNLSVEVLNQKEIEKLGMNSMLAVSRGSDEEPKFIRLNYKGSTEKTITLIGKGVTFDSGGLSLKPGKMMETMKLDMAGAASILGIFSAFERIKPKVNVAGLIAACENMPSGKAMKPGDVVIAANGKSIEILNTDAEGRMMLADSFSYASKFIKSDEMIDLATLTGACVVALGEDVAGLFSNDEKLAEKLIKIAGISGEKIWRMPLVSDYRKLLDSPIADIKNVSKSRYGGAITGALFIKDFVPENVPWAHIDMGGPGFSESNQPLTPYGATGFGVRTILNYLISFD